MCSNSLHHAPYVEQILFGRENEEFFVDSSELQSSLEERDFVLVLKYEFSSNSCVRHYKCRLKALNGSGRPGGS